MLNPTQDSDNFLRFYTQKKQRIDIYLDMPTQKVIGFTKLNFKAKSDIKDEIENGCVATAREAGTMFEGIGKIGDYVQLKELRTEAKYRLKTGQDMKKQIQKQVADDIWRQMTTKVSKKTDEARVAGIKQKLRSGKELSASEMKYLKETDEDLYTKAKKAQEARDELRSALKRAKTKNEARMALVQAQAKVSTEALLEAKSGSGVNVTAGMDGAAAAAGSAGETASAADPGGEATGAASMDTSVDADVAGNGTQAAETTTDAASGANAETVASQSSEHGQAEATSENGAASSDEKAEDGTKTENRRQTLENLERGGDGSKMDFDTKFIYQMRALQDEWNRYEKDKSYQELPENDLEAVQEPRKHKYAYDPKRKNDVLTAGDAYDTAANLLLAKVEAEGTTTIEK